MDKERILLVDDEKDMLRGLQRLLEKSLGSVEILTAGNGEEALVLVQEGRFSLALVDIQMPGINGLELMELLQKKDPLLTVVMMTAFGTIEIAVDAMKQGAYDFIAKPFDRSQLVRVIQKGLTYSRLLRENLNLRRQVESMGESSLFIGQSGPMQRLRDNIQTIGKTDYTVLVRGASGTGKELAARALHMASHRAKNRMVMVNCPAIPEHLLESELFGYLKGAFTGAEKDHQGLFAEADGSTICLDEIGDIPVSVQTKLLRVLQEREIRPLGASAPLAIDVRVIAMTNQNLEEKIRDKSFREDLYYRLNVITLQLPDLEDIRDDISLLASHFIRQACADLDVESKHLSPEANKELMNRSWPGNVRELQNVVRRSVLFCPEQVIQVKHLFEQKANRVERGMVEIEEIDLDEVVGYKESRDRLLRRFETLYIEKLLLKTQGNVTRAAELSGLTRAALQKILRRTQVSAEKFRLKESKM